MKPGMIWGVLFLMLMQPVVAQENTYLRELVQRAREARLAESQEWLNLLHYKPYPYWAGSRSLADDPGFFNAENGMRDAQAELDATLAAFFSDTQETDKQQNPQCRFVARYHWLNSHLQFDPVRMKEQECKRYNNWFKALNPHEVTLVFPSSYINSPASMYGHTLLRIDAKDQNERTRLLAYTIGYTASTNETNGLLFAYMGLTGGYPGIFQIMPYYLKVREYSDMENRDIWEYRLNLNAEEIDRMMRHIWEIGPTYFAYYFLDENCAYHLLSLLEVARPGLNLTDEFRWWAIPSDTVRAVTEQKGLVVATVYRPSNATIVMHRLRAMVPEQRKLSLSLSHGNMEPDHESIIALPKRVQAEVLELGLDYVTYLQADKGEKPEYSARLRKLQLARSALDIPTAMPVIKEPEVRPDQGHQSLRMGIGAGNRDGMSYQELSIRPAYHDQHDPGAGYVRGAQIQFFNIRLRHYGNDEGMRLEEFVPLDIYSLSPRSDYFKSLSWKVNAGWSRKRLAEGNEPLLGHLNAGAGYAWDTPSLENPHALSYLLLDATLEGASQYQASYAFGMGPAAGVIADVSPSWQVNLMARVQRFALGEIHTQADLSLLQRFAFGRQSALRLEMARKMQFDQYWNDINASWQVYF